MAIKHLTPRKLNRKQKEEYDNSFLELKEAEFIEEMSEKHGSVMEIYLPVKQCKKLYDMVINKKYKIKTYMWSRDEDEDKIEANAQRYLDKGWELFWNENNYDQGEYIFVKPPIIKEDAMGGVSAPISTPLNVPGMGSATPPSAKTGGIGSGDNWGNSIGKKTYTQNGVAKKKKKAVIKRTKKVKESLDEENVSPYDKIGQSMLKRAKVKSVFKKKKSKGNQNAMKQQKFEHEIIPFDEFKKISENL
jgi:hypothetical protein